MRWTVIKVEREIESSLCVKGRSGREPDAPYCVVTNGAFDVFGGEAIVTIV